MLDLTSILGCFSMKCHLYLAMFLRIGLIHYGEYQDNRLMVKFTDVDYRVFTDAARHMWAEGGESPYHRHTYRYTPILAWLMIPNLTISPLFGKYLFCLLDIFAGYLIYTFVKNCYRCHFGPNKIEFQARVCAFLWLYNPLVFAVSARGNAESIVVTLVLITMHLFSEKVFVLAGIAFGLSIHFKIYPIIYSISFYLALSDKEGIWSLFQVNANASTNNFRITASLSMNLMALSIADYPGPD